MTFPRISLAVAVVASTGITSVAEPADPRDPDAASPTCSVDLVRVPSDVRAIVERWIHAEPRCNVHLEVRIVPTEGGFYVLARDDRGRSHERVVPDATSAGVLIASWASDDAVAPPPRRRANRPLKITAIGSPRTADPDAPLPLRASLVVDRGDDVEHVEPVTVERLFLPRERTFSVSGFTSVVTFGGRNRTALHGVRGNIEYWPGKHWTVGVGASMATGYKDSFTDAMGVVDTAALFHVGVTSGPATWEVTPSIGGGLMLTAANGVNQVSLVGQAQFVMSIALNPRLSVVGGPSLTLYTASRVDTALERVLDFMLSGGIRWGS